MWVPTRSTEQGPGWCVRWSVTTDEVLADLGARRHGVITTVDARSRGVSTDQLYTRVRQGRLRRVHRGVFVIAGSPDTWERRIAAAVLGAGEGSLASHSTAAALLQLNEAPFERVEVTVPRHRLPRLDRVLVHRSICLEADDHAATRSIPVTSAARTIVDLTAVRGIGWIARAMDDAMRRNLALLPELRECSNRLRGAPGRRPSVVRMLVDERWEYWWWQDRKWSRADRSPSAPRRGRPGAGAPARDRRRGSSLSPRLCLA